MKPMLIIDFTTWSDEKLLHFYEKAAAAQMAASTNSALVQITLELDRRTK
jgi:hypothetical protein